MMKRSVKKSEGDATRRIGRQRAIVAAVGFGIMTVIVILIAVIEGPKTASVRVRVAPLDAKVEIVPEREADGATYGNGVHNIRPGKYIVKISKAGFQEAEEELVVAKGETGEILACLAQENGSWDWMEAGGEEEQICYEASERQTAIGMQEYLAQDPALSKTPYRNTQAGFGVYAEMASDGAEHDGIDDGLGDEEATINDNERRVRLTMVNYGCSEAYRSRAEKYFQEWMEENGLEMGNYEIQREFICGE